ncbi:hypothetical protein EXE49_01840 [Halorubrum sp. ASP121]|uniref:hypothetical protein n=1 Tax=Halorubrum sp. ASP121 TaxID=1855858 RepID=UPI0010FA4181|nr:hypothetical protein [Halorubrum sp. ASP121]TKX51653.1 hypothetical protein EXE49_01840 [Halorubrum sp. ASP121]
MSQFSILHHRQTADEGSLFDADEVERLVLDHGMANSTEAKDRTKGNIVDETVGAVYTDDIPEQMDFPSETPLLVALIQLHRETDDPDVLHHIEREVEVVRDGFVNIAEFDVKPYPYAAHFDLLAYAARFEGRNDPTSRYFRLRAFKALGAFDNVGMLQIRDTGGLTDEEREYLETM